MYPDIYRADPQRYDSVMKYRRCGQSGILLPEVSLGFWHNFGGVNTMETSLAMVHYAFDHGVTHFDLANNYGPPYGSAEETFGRIMQKSMSPYRHEMFISTKAGYDMWPGPYGNFGSRKYLITSLEQSLRRMNLDYVDLFYSHRFDPDTPMRETLQALVDIVRAGKALYVGISNWPAAESTYAYQYLAERDVPCLIYQGKYSIFNQDPAKNGVLEAAKAAGAGFIAFSPLAQGLLTDRYLNGIPEGSRMARGAYLKPEMLTDDKLDRIRSLDAIARDGGMSLAHMALAWCLSDQRVTSVLVGTSSVEQLKANLAAVGSAPLSADMMRAIARVIDKPQ